MVKTDKQNRIVSDYNRLNEVFKLTFHVVTKWKAVPLALLKWLYTCLTQTRNYIICAIVALSVNLRLLLLQRSFISLEPEDVFSKQLLIQHPTILDSNDLVTQLIKWKNKTVTVQTHVVPFTIVFTWCFGFGTGKFNINLVSVLVFTSSNTGNFSLKINLLDLSHTIILHQLPFLN